MSDSPSIKGVASPTSVDPGDLVEVLSREGTVQGFGVVTFCTAAERFDYISANGELLQAKLDNVFFAIRGVYPSLPSKQYDVPLITAQLNEIIARSCNGVKDLLPLLTVVHSQLCVQDRPRAVSFEYVYERVKKLKTVTNFSPKSSAVHSINPANQLQRGVSRLSLYLAMTYHALTFVRMPGTPFAVVSSQTMDIVNKVMTSLTQVELEHGASQLAHGNIQNSTLANTLRGFLDHYVLWNDERLVPAAKAILETCDGGVRRLDSVRGFSSVFSKLDGLSLFPWLIKELQPKDSKIDSQRRNGSPSSSSSSAKKLTANLIRKSNVSQLFTCNSVEQCTMFDKQTAASFDPRSSTLSTFIPLVKGLDSPLKLTSSIGVAARTAKLLSRSMSMLPESVTRKFEYSLRVPRQSLRLTVKLDPLVNSLDFDTANIDVCMAMPIVDSVHRVDKALENALMSVDPLISVYEIQIPANCSDEIDNGAVIETAERAKNKPRVIRRANEDEEIPQTSPVEVTHIQSIAGRIAGKFMAARNLEAPYVVTTKAGLERFSSEAGLHSRIREHAYVPISRPFDSSIALLVQKLLLDSTVPKRLYNGTERPPLSSKMRQALIPQLNLISSLENRDSLYWTLLNLQEQLRDSLTFHIFRCTILEDSEPQGHPEGQLVKAYCYDLDIEVEVFVSAHTEKLFYGDQVIGTEILELDPLLGLFIVSM